MRDRFHVELQAHRGLFASLRSELRGRSFVSLRGQSLALDGSGDWTLIDDATTVLSKDALLIRLDPHLRALSASVALPDAAGAPRQLDLFSLPSAHGASLQDHRSRGRQPSTILNRRRSA